MIQYASSLRATLGSKFIGNSMGAWGGALYALVDSLVELDGKKGQIDLVENHGPGGAPQFIVYYGSRLVTRGDVNIQGGVGLNQVGFVQMDSSADFGRGLRYRDNIEQPASGWGALAIGTNCVVVADGILIEDNVPSGFQANDVSSLFFSNSIVRRNSVVPQRPNILSLCLSFLSLYSPILSPSHMGSLSSCSTSGDSHTKRLQCVDVAYLL